MLSPLPRLSGFLAPSNDRKIGIYTCTRPIHTEVPEYISNLLALVRKLYSRIFRAQGNIAALLRMIYSWALSPILQRKDLKDENLLAVAERDEAFQRRYDKIEQAARELSRVLNENYKLLFDLLPDSAYERSEFESDEGIITRVS